MKFKLSAIVWREGKQYVSKCPELEVASAGDTVEEAKDNLREAVELYLENAIELNMINDIRNVIQPKEIFTTELEEELSGFS